MSSFKLKVLLTGSADTEKTELFQKFIKNRFQQNYKLSVGVDILTKDVEFSPNEIATLSIWDIGSQQRFEFIRNTFYKGAAGAMVVFNLNKRESFFKALHWITEIRDFTGQRLPVVLIGNQISSTENNEITINKEDVQNFVKKEKLMYIETSTKTGVNISDVFHQLTKCIIEKRLK
jgi:small GTP-binding protein